MHSHDWGHRQRRTEQMQKIHNFLLISKVLFWKKKPIPKK